MPDIGNWLRSIRGAAQQKPKPKPAEDAADLSLLKTGEAREAAEKRSEVFREAHVFSIGCFSGEIEIVGGPEISVEITGTPEDIAECNVSQQDAVVNLEGPARYDSDNQSIIITNSVIQVGRNFNGFINGVRYKNGKPESENAPEQPPLKARIVVPPGTPFRVGSAHTLLCRVPLGDLVFDTRHKSNMTFGKVGGVSGVIGNYSEVSLGEINGQLSADIERNATFKAGALNSGEAELRLKVSGYARADIAGGECGEAHFTLERNAAASILDFKTGGNLGLIADDYAEGEYEGTASGNITVNAGKNAKLELKGRAGGSLSIAAKGYATVTYEGEAGGEVTVDIKKNSEVTTCVDVTGGALRVNADGYAELDHKGSISQDLEIVADNHSAIRLEGNVSGAVSIDAKDYAEVACRGNIDGNVTASAEHHAEIATKGAVAGGFTAEASEYSGVRHSGTVAGQVDRQADRSSDVRIG